MKLGINFSLNELTKSQTAVRRGINNQPNETHLLSLKKLVKYLLQPIRTALGPVRITSGYRSSALNKAIKGSTKSQHMKGEAADFEITGMDNYDLAKFIIAEMDFDQLIFEFYDVKVGGNSGWIHCSYVDSGNRFKVLTAARNPTTKKTDYFNGLKLNPYNDDLYDFDLNHKE